MNDHEKVKILVEVLSLIYRCLLVGGISTASDRYYARERINEAFDKTGETLELE